ncbi:DUF975 family protein [Chakrabartyella piscis]|uniref:DUF975 family protein n=1 Tax=Chakrabartyella piscis TaxID=2918914 RepID=UPI0029589F42|nr:DUF975 family protein [Chakrabartyella piscis]
MDRGNLKRMAKEQIKGNIGMLFVCSLLMWLCLAAVELVPVLGIVISALVTPALSIGTMLIYLRLAEGEPVRLETLMERFSIFWKCFVTAFLTVLYCFLWSLLFVIPGIIKSYSYFMVYFILAEHPEYSASQVIQESKRMMDGHKMELFVLHLTFIPWTLLMIVTFGIAGIYAIPYINATTANFYNGIKPQAIVEPALTEFA